jgi:hypothetical protein
MIIPMDIGLLNKHFLKESSLWRDKSKIKGRNKSGKLDKRILRDKAPKTAMRNNFFSIFPFLSNSTSAQRNGITIGKRSGDGEISTPQRRAKMTTIPNHSADIMPAKSFKQIFILTT